MLSFLVFVLGLAVIVGYTISSVKSNERTKQPLFRVGNGVTVGFMLLGTIVLSQLAGSIVIVGAGERVVVFDKFTGVKKDALGEGFHLILPFVQDAITFDVRIQKEEFETSAASKDLQDVTTKVALNVSPSAEAVSTIYQRYGKDYNEKVVHPAVQEVVKAVMAQYTAEELITRREEVKNKVETQLREFLASANLNLDKAYITNFEFSKNFAEAIEQKQIAEQNALKAQRVLEQVKTEAEQKIANAKAEAESLRLQKEQITPALLELRKIEANREAIAKWDGKLPETIMGNGAIPFINMSKSQPTDK